MKGRTMSKKRLFSAAVVVAVLAAASVLATTTASAKPAKKQATVKLGFITKFPVDFYFTLVERGEEVGQGDAGREGHLRQRQERHRRRGRDRRDPEHGRPGREGHRHHADEPGRVRRARQGDQGGGQGRPDRQRHPEVEEEELGRRDEQLQRRRARRASTSPTKLKAGDTLGILEGIPANPALVERVTGMLAGLGALKSKIKVVSKLETDCDQTKGATAAQTILTANQDLTAIYSACGPPALGAIQSIKNAGIKPGEIILVGFDASPDEVKAIKAGTETASVAQFPAKMGSLGIATL